MMFAGCRGDCDVLLSSVRSFPRARLAGLLGYRRDRRDGSRWTRPGSVVSVTGSKFFDHVSGRGGGGAIDFVMHARGCDFRSAVSFLSGSGLGSGVMSERVGFPERPRDRVLSLPAVSASLWPEVRDYVVEVRGVDEDLVEACHRLGLLYADGRKSAVFVARNASGTFAGAELVGIPARAGGRGFKGMALGSRKSRGGFWLCSGACSPGAVFLAESALDALSALSLSVAPARREAGFTVVSTGGVAGGVPAWLEAWRPRRIFCGYDADRAGDEAAAGLCRSDARVVRWRPCVEGEKPARPDRGSDLAHDPCIQLVAAAHLDGDRVAARGCEPAGLGRDLLGSCTLGEAETAHLVAPPGSARTGRAQARSRTSQRAISSPASTWPERPGVRQDDNQLGTAVGSSNLSHRRSRKARAACLFEKVEVGRVGKQLPMIAY